MAASLFTQIALVVAGLAILVILYLGGVSKSLKGGIVEIAIRCRRAGDRRHRPPQSLSKREVLHVNH